MADSKAEAETEIQKKEEEKMVKEKNDEGEDEEGSSSDSSYLSEFSDSSDEEEEGEEDESDREKVGEGKDEKRKGKIEEEEVEKEEEEEDEEEEEEEESNVDEQAAEEDLWNFPPDTEGWTEEDLGEHWEDYWGDTQAVGWDPNFVSEGSWETYEELWRTGEPGPPGTPYYVPYRKFYPPIPDNHFDIQTPEDVVEELERTEQFLVWYSYLFKDGSSYEGTVWDDLAHGKGVYTTAYDLVRYEGDFFQNLMQGHGVIEADIPVDEPIPDSEEAIEAKKEGKILRSDYMEPFDREWLKMDIEEQFQEHGRPFEPWYERETWIEEYGELPEKGHYKYAGQWKHSRFHGCGVYEINGRPIWGKFYFGELLPDPEECNSELSALHASLGEVAAAKARMFANKPDGMVRQVKGPFTDPSHPYMYEEEDLWMAPGFINEYYEVPEEWKVYVEDLDAEREMWLNSFMKAPFVVPMPPELDYMWKEEDEFVLLGNTPSAMLELNPENVERASKELQGEVLLHVPTGRIINWVTDAEGRLRFFFQPITENGKVIPEAIQPLEEGFDEFMKEDKDEAEAADRKKRNIFQIFKDEWAKYSEQHKEERESKKEEMARKWKQEDQAAEYRWKLKKAERFLAYQIEMEKLRAERKSKSAPEDEAIDQTQSADETTQEQQEDETGVENSNVEDADESSKVEDADESQEVEGSKEDKETDKETAVREEEEDDEDDKKPRSFGKVAMVGFEDDTAKHKYTKEASREQASLFPTAFASLTLGSQMALCEALKSKFGKVVADLWHERVQLGSTRSMKSENQCDVHSHGPKAFVHVKPSFITDNLRLRVSRSSPNCASRTMVRTRWSKQRGVCCVKSYQANSVGQHQSNKYVDRSRWLGSEDIAWTKPVFDFLSMALPIEQ